MSSPAETSNGVGHGTKIQRITQAMILAAGEGSRLRPLTLEKPKPMVDIAGKPLLERTLCWLRSHGVSEVIINLHYKPDAITDYLGDGSAWDMHIRYSREDSILGTAGGLKNCESMLNSTFYLIYGDVLTDLDLSRIGAVHQNSHKDGRQPVITAGVYVVPNPTECGIVDFDQDGWIRRIVEKPRQEEVFGDLALSGIFAMEKEAISEVPANTFYDVGYNLLPKLLAKGYTMVAIKKDDSEYLLDIGSLEKYTSACREWAHRSPEYANALEAY